MKTQEFFEKYPDILIDDKGRRSILKFRTMTEAWSKINDVSLILKICSEYKPLSDELLKRLAIAYAERVLYLLPLSVTCARLAVDAAKNYVILPTDENRVLLMNCFKKINEFTSVFNIKQKDLKNRLDNIRYDDPAFPSCLAEYNEFTTSAITPRYVASAATSAMIAVLSDEKNQIINSVIDTAARAAVTVVARGEHCDVFRRLVANPFKPYYAPSNIKEWINEYVIFPITNFIFDPLSPRK